MTTRVNTVEGTMLTEEMGRTLIHEHVIGALPGWNFDPRAPKFIRTEALHRAVDQLQELADYGCTTMVDPCPIDVGRDVEFVAEVAQRSGIKIVCATGIYHEAEGITYPFRKMNTDELVELYVTEIEDGIGTTGIKAGVVKIATGEGSISEYERKALTAAARASRLTGVPIISHTQLASLGHEQLDILRAEGVETNCVVVGHLGDRDDVDYQESIAKKGAFVGLDRFGLEFVLPDEVRIRNMIELVRRGYRENLMISQDHVVCLLGTLGLKVAEMHPEMNMVHMFRNLFPKMKEGGVTDEDLSIILDNPRRLFNNAMHNKCSH